MDTGTSVFCPCGETVDTRSNSIVSSYLPRTFNDRNTLHDPADLLFCSTCRSIRCPRCTESQIACKYCSNCMNLSTEDVNYCARNCFVCPDCSCNLSISTILDGDGWKSFKFSCSFCKYSYTTESLEKPRSLTKAINSISESQDVFLRQFSGLQKFYSAETKPKLNKEILLRLSNLQLKNLDKFGGISENTYEEVLFDEDEEIAQLRAMISGEDPKKENQKKLPIPRKLRTKVSFKCKSCRNMLVQPEADPVSTKFYYASNAIDFLPLIKISPVLNESFPELKPSTTVNVMLNVVNPMLLPIDFSISTFHKIPGKVEHLITLPVSRIAIGARPEKLNKPDLYVKTIPTVELTQNTRISRTELLKRLGNLKSGRTHDEGVNWCSIPLTISIDQVSSSEMLEIPFFCGVTSKSVSFGFWMVVEIGKIVLD